MIGTLNHETFNFKALIHENVVDIVCKMYLLLVLSKRSIRRKERIRTGKDYAIIGEITTVLKIAVDSVILDLCDSRDYSASPFLVETTD